MSKLPKILNRKKTNSEFDLLGEKLIDSIPDLQTPDGQGEKMLAAARLFYYLEASRKKIISELHGCTDYSEPATPQIKYDPGSDAAALLRGEPLGNLSALAEENHRLSLLRQLRACETAAPQAQIKIAEEEMKVIQSECSRLRPILEPIVRATLDAATNLLICLRTEKQLFDLLSRRGFVGDKRPGWLRMWDLPSTLLYGGVHGPSLQYFIEQRRESAGLGKSV